MRCAVCCFSILVPTVRTLATPKNTRNCGNGITVDDRYCFTEISENAQKSQKSVICGLPALAEARVRVLGADQKKSGPALGTRMLFFLNTMLISQIELIHKWRSYL